MPQQSTPDGTAGKQLDSATILANARALAPTIRGLADEIEKHRRLPDSLVKALSDSGVFRIAMPAAWGGPEMDPLDQIELMEILAYADPSTAWCVSILSDGGYYAGFLDDSVARELFPNLDTRCAGMLAPVGVAEVVSGGYKITGNWTFGSASLHATHLTGGCIILEDGQPIVEDTGLPRWRVMVFDADDAEITDTWFTTGLAGSGSNDYRVADLFVPTKHSFEVFAAPQRTEPLYGYHGFFFANVPGVVFGMARAALDEAWTVAETKRSFGSPTPLIEDPSVLTTFGEAEAALAASRAFVTDAIGSAFTTLQHGDTLTLRQRAHIGLCITHAGRTATQIVNHACDIVGTVALYRKSRLERLRRDMITASAHIVHQRKTFGTAAQMLSGGPTTMSPF
jgi:alkylation response protein AidB-like acyl-CoA dehydrogenase